VPTHDGRVDTRNIPHRLPLTAGARYVLFFSISKDYEANGPTAGIPGFAGYIPTDAYSEGDFVFINNEGDANKWTTVPWTHYALSASLKTISRQGELLAVAADQQGPMQERRLEELRHHLQEPGRVREVRRNWSLARR
jgi:hypothetical protein